MRIVIGTFYRTGSTWLFNAVRLSCIEAGLSVKVSGNMNLEDFDEDVCIHKIHLHSAEMERAADHVFTIERDLSDADASFLRAFGNPCDPAHRKKSLRAAMLWRKAAMHPFHFDDIKQNPMRILTGISIELGLKFGSQDLISVHSKLKALKPPTDKTQDPESLYFSRHITSE